MGHSIFCFIGLGSWIIAASFLGAGAAKAVAALFAGIVCRGETHVNTTGYEIRGLFINRKKSLWE